MKKMLASVLSLIVIMLILSSCSNSNLSVNEEPFDVKYSFQSEIENYDAEYQIVDNTLFGKGQNSFKVFGEDSSQYYNDWVELASDVVHVDACSGTVIYLTDAGQVYGFGLCDGGVLQSEDSEDLYENFISKPVLLFENCKYASIGTRFVVAIKNDDTLWFWGESLNGQSTEIKEKILEPKQIADNVCCAEAFGYTTAWIDKDKSLYLCGDNSFGQIGNGESGCGFPTMFEDIVTNPYCALKDCVSFKVIDNETTMTAKTIDGKEYEWGNNNHTIPTVITK
ncbi:MAG: hypothetical protein K2K01_06940 [Eubacterium sp.]|nr:hypothetical protein [Eubacterium sp.]